MVGWNTPSSITPALRNRSTRSRMLPSATSAATAAMMTRCGKLSKNPLMSASSTWVCPSRWSSRTLLHRPMAVAAGPEPVRIVVKQPLEERAQEEADHLLGHPVADGGDPQRTRLALTLGDMDATQGEGFIRPILQAPHQGEQVVYEVSLEGLDALPVNPRGSAIPPDVAEGEQQERQGDPSRQRMVLDLGHVEPFPVEPHETETLEAFGGQARGGCFLASPAGFGRGPSGLSRPVGANCPHGSGRVFLREHGTSFHPWAELLRRCCHP